MTRNEFLRYIKLGILGLAAGGIRIDNLYADTGKKTKHKKWVWMTPWRDISNDEYKKRFEKIKLAGIDAIIPNIYAGWSASYNSSHLPVSMPLLEQFAPIAKEMELEIHAWMWTMICNNEDIIEKNPSWFAINRNGLSTVDNPAYVGYYRFMCPNNPGVRNFVSTTVSELSQFTDLDGIHLDYVRFPDVILAEKLQLKYGIVQDREYPEYDYCYCHNCRGEFKDLTGIEISEINNPEENESWREFRYNSITKMVNEFLVPAAKKNNKFISAAVFPNWENVRQQWSKWNVDAVFPMLYHKYYNEELDWILHHILKGKKLLNKSTKLYCGLLVDMFEPDEFRSALIEILRSETDGISFFGLNALERMGMEKISGL